MAKKALKKLLFPGKYLGREVDALTAQVEQQRQIIDDLQQEVRALRHVLPTDARRFAGLMKPLLPHGATGVKKVRKGSAHDGGYIMLDDIAGVTAVYSLGVGRDVSWDLAMAQLGLPVFQFDHTVEGPPTGHPLFRFHRQKIGLVHQPERNVVSLGEVLRQNGHLGKKIILKMDIDGAEWEVLDQIDGELLANCTQILCELHHLNRWIDPAWSDCALRAIGKLTQNHRLVHIHGNNYVPTFWNGSTDFPDVLEASFASQAAYKLAPSGEIFPGPLDSPNARDQPDIPLGDFRFDPAK